MTPSRDALTGLGDHAAFEAALARARRRTEVAVVLLDIRGLDTGDDERARQAGDRVLLGLAARLSGTLRTGDELFRLGGDAFGALVALTEQREAAAVAERLGDAAQAAAPAGVIVGVAVPHGRESDAAVLARAVKALAAR
jgi:diguanylate cyclase (GGDEF)-like protein